MSPATDSQTAERLPTFRPGDEIDVVKLIIGDVPPGLCRCGCGSKAPLATTTRSRLGYRKGEPRLYIRGHRNTRRTTCSVDANGCWIWTGVLTDGYARTRVRGKTVALHRYVYQHLVGAIPDELEIDHLCRNRACCNPAHLEAVTKLENVRRGQRPKLTADAVLEIKAQRMSRSELAAKFGVTPTYIRAIQNGYARTWEDLT